MTKKEMTLDDLARMVQEGFAETASKKLVEDIAKSVDERFDEVREGFEDINHRFRGIEDRLDAYEQILKTIRDEVSMLHKERLMDEIDIRELKLRVERLEKRLGV